MLQLTVALARFTGESPIRPSMGSFPPSMGSFPPSMGSFPPFEELVSCFARSWRGLLRDLPSRGRLTGKIPMLFARAGCLRKKTQKSTDILVPTRPHENSSPNSSQKIYLNKYLNKITQNRCTISLDSGLDLS